MRSYGRIANTIILFKLNQTLYIYIYIIENILFYFYLHMEANYSYHQGSKLLCIVYFHINYKKLLLRIQVERNSDDSGSWEDLEEDIFSDEFLLTRPLLEAIRSEEPVVLLIDEVDRVEIETEALLLEILSDYQVSIPELGTVEARQIPLVFLTSNNTRELSEALKRRCLFLHIDYPDLEREREIILTKVPDINENLGDQIARVVRTIRDLELKKAPSVSETLDWARTLVHLGVEHIDAKTATETVNILLKYRSDIEKAVKEFSTDEQLNSEEE